MGGPSAMHKENVLLGSGHAEQPQNTLLSVEQMVWDLPFGVNQRSDPITWPLAQECGWTVHRKAVMSSSVPRHPNVGLPYMKLKGVHFNRRAEVSEKRVNHLRLSCNVHYY